MIESELEKLVDSSLSHKEFIKQLSEYLCVSVRTIYEWIGGKFKTIENKRDLLIFKLSLLGWTQQEIADVVVHAGFEKTFSQKAVSLCLEDFADLQKLLKLQFREGKGKSISDIVEENKETQPIDEQLAWAIVLKGKTDIERFKLMGFIKEKEDKESWQVPKVYDVWYFTECDKRIGQEHSGQIPGQIVLNTLYYYTKPGELVIDLMAGGGVANDACLLMGRKCYSYDINPKREDIIQHDFLNGLPERAKKASLIFLDPPYFKKKEIEYGSESISALNREDYLKSMDKLAEICEGRRVAFVMGKYYDYEKPRDSIFITEYVNIFEKHGFRQIDEISINQTPPEGGQHAVGQAKKKHRMEIIKRDLLLLEA